MEMTKSRLEAFSDGVIAIIITIMVLEFKTPTSAGLDALVEIAPKLATYLLSFIFMGIYWNNHHHMLHHVKRINGAVLWANLHLLFWLSLVPFATSWVGQTHFAPYPVMTYAVVLLDSGFAYFILSRALIKANGKESEFAKRLGSDLKGNISVLIYAASIPIALKAPLVSVAMFAVVACMWLVPDKRFER